MAQEMAPVGIKSRFNYGGAGKLLMQMKTAEACIFRKLISGPPTINVAGEHLGDAISVPERSATGRRA